MKNLILLLMVGSLFVGCNKSTDPTNPPICARDYQYSNGVLSCFNDQSEAVCIANLPSDSYSIFYSGTGYSSCEEYCGQVERTFEAVYCGETKYYYGCSSIDGETGNATEDCI